MYRHGAERNLGVDRQNGADLVYGGDGTGSFQQVPRLLQPFYRHTKTACALVPPMVEKQPLGKRSLAALEHLVDMHPGNTAGGNRHDAIPSIRANEGRKAVGV